MRGQILPILAAAITAIGVSIGLLQSPAIPVGPAWAVAMTLLGGIVLLVIKEVGKIRRNGNGIKLDREQIKGELTLLSLVSATHELATDLVTQGNDMKDLLRRMTDVLDRSQQQAEINAGALETLIRQMVQNGERLQHIPTKDEFLAEHEHTRHALRNDAVALNAGGRLPPTVTR